MTNYAVDERNVSLVGIWATGRGDLCRRRPETDPLAADWD